MVSWRHNFYRVNVDNPKTTDIEGKMVDWRHNFYGVKWIIRKPPILKGKILTTKIGVHKLRNGNHRYRRGNHVIKKINLRISYSKAMGVIRDPGIKSESDLADLEKKMISEEKNKSYRGTVVSV